MTKKNDTNNQFEESGRRVTTIVSLISISYFVCWLPWNISVWLDLATLGKLGNIIQTMVIQPLKFANHFMNPIICLFASEKFRSDAKELFGCSDADDSYMKGISTTSSRRGTIFSSAGGSWRSRKNKQSRQNSEGTKSDESDKNDLIVRNQILTKNSVPPIQVVSNGKKGILGSVVQGSSDSLRVSDMTRSTDQ